MGSFIMNRVEFPDEIWRLWSQYAEFPPTINYYSYFVTHVLCYNQVWLNAFERSGERRRVSGQVLWLVRCRISSDEDLFAYGCGVNSSVASDICAKRLFDVLLSRYPTFFMPKFIIGYPNARGHCYLIAPLLLLLHSYPISLAIIRGMEISFGAVNAGAVSVRKQHLLDEYPYYWIRLFCKIYRNYYKISASGTLEQENIPILRGAIAGDYVPQYPADNVNADLQLDRDLINDLCSSLRDFCNDSYGTPGGQSALSYIDIMQKLSYDIADFRDRFFFKLDVSYLCRYCPRGPFKGVFYCPVLSLESKCGIQESLFDLGEVIKQQDLSCRQVVDGQPCGHVLERFDSASLLNLPEIMCFYVQRESAFTSLQIPDEIGCFYRGQRHVYQLLGSTCCFNCYEDANGVPYGSFYHKKVDGDKRTTAHVVAHLRTSRGFVEINNGSVYDCDPRIFMMTTPGSLHLYQKIKYADFLSQVLDSEVKPAPCK